MIEALVLYIIEAIYYGILILLGTAAVGLLAWGGFLAWRESRIK